MIWYPRSPPCDAKPAAPESALWADPRAVMSQAAVRQGSVPIDIAGVTLVAPADPKRIALGFSFGNGGGAYFAPNSEPDRSGFYVVSNSTSSWVWFDLFTYGPLVNEAWYCGMTANISVWVYEIYRLQ